MFFIVLLDDVLCHVPIHCAFSIKAIHCKSHEIGQKLNVRKEDHQKERNYNLRPNHEVPLDIVVVIRPTKILNVPDRFLLVLAIEPETVIRQDQDDGRVQILHRKDTKHFVGEVVRKVLGFVQVSDP